MFAPDCDHDDRQPSRPERVRNAVRSAGVSVHRDGRVASWGRHVQALLAQARHRRYRRSVRHLQEDRTIETIG